MYTMIHATSFDMNKKQTETANLRQAYFDDRETVR